jgi:hypothetical protein
MAAAHAAGYPNMSTFIRDLVSQFMAGTPTRDRRPSRQGWESGPEIRVFWDDDSRIVHQTMRQIGWHGQSGAFYALGEDPGPEETGSWTPIWVVVHASELPA